jgi:hypothetical protein
VLLLLVVVLSVVELTSGACTLLWLVVVVCDRSDACGAGSAGTETAHPAALRPPIKRVRAPYAEIVVVLFFIASM